MTLATGTLAPWALVIACGSESGVATDEGDGGDGGDMNALVRGDGKNVEAGSGAVPATDGGDGGDGGDAEDGGDAGASGEDLDCGLTPTLHPEALQQLRCPEGPPVGSQIFCNAGERCCERTVDASWWSSCAATCPEMNGVPFPGPVWECQRPEQCATGVCCGTGRIEFDSYCGYIRARTFTGTTCKASCASNEYVVCEDDSQCTGGKICKPLKARGGQMGACLAP